MKEWNDIHGYEEKSWVSGEGVMGDKLLGIGGGSGNIHGAGGGIDNGFTGV
jgi:hypothetical protein